MRRTGTTFALCVVALLASLVLATGLGSTAIAPAEVIDAIRSVAAKGFDLSRATPAETIVWQIRLPRALLGALVGALLAASGVVLQALVRNPLADPYILGVSSGASAGAATVLVLGVFSWLGIFALSAGAFLGALIAVGIVFLASRVGGAIAPQTLILSGVAVAGVFAAITSLIALSSDDNNAARAVMSWTLGSLASARWDTLGPVVVLGIGGLVWLIARAPRLDPLLAGDEAASALGTDVQRLRIEMLVIATLVTAAAVAASGAIGFVGLLVPHAVRKIVGGRHQVLLPLSALVGAIYLVWVDIAARLLMPPAEIPIGVLTALIGGPFFVLIIRGIGKRNRVAQ